jgi:hypothetical protein
MPTYRSSKLEEPKNVNEKQNYPKASTPVPKFLLEQRDLVHIVAKGGYSSLLHIALASTLSTTTKISPLGIKFTPKGETILLCSSPWLAHTVVPLLSVRFVFAVKFFSRRSIQSHILRHAKLVHSPKTMLQSNNYGTHQDGFKQGELRHIPLFSNSTLEGKLHHKPRLDFNSGQAGWQPS